MSTDTASIIYLTWVTFAYYSTYIGLNTCYIIAFKVLCFCKITYCNHTLDGSRIVITGVAGMYICLTRCKFVAPL